MLKAVRSFLRRVIGSDRVRMRYVVPTRREQTEAQRREANRRASINAQLAVYSAVTTAEQRRTETEAYIARKRAELGFVPRAEKRSEA